MTPKERNSSFELLRIISMVLIISYHYAYHGRFDFFSPLSLGLYFVQCLDMGGKLGVNLFILISGFFLCKSRFNWKRILKLEFEVIFYSAAIGIIFHFFEPGKQGLKGLVKDFFPLYNGRYWFYTVYFSLVILSPLINKFINSIQKQTFREILAALAVILIFTRVTQQSNIAWFVFLYLTASYIRFFPEDFKFRGRTYILFGIASYLMIFVYILICDLFSLKNIKFREAFDFFMPQDSVLIFLSSVFLFTGFSKFDFGNKKIINIAASATFGVYLLHDNHLLRGFLWEDFFKNASYLETGFIIPHALITTFIVYTACTAIELFRQFVLEKPFFKMMEKLGSKKKSI